MTEWSATVFKANRCRRTWTFVVNLCPSGQCDVFHCWLHWKAKKDSQAYFLLSCGISEWVHDLEISCHNSRNRTGVVVHCILLLANRLDKVSLFRLVLRKWNVKKGKTKADIIFQTIIKVYIRFTFFVAFLTANFSQKNDNERETS